MLGRINRVSLNIIPVLISTLANGFLCSFCHLRHKAFRAVVSVPEYSGTPLIRGVRIKPGSQKKVTDTCFLDAKTKANVFTATKRCLIVL